MVSLQKEKTKNETTTENFQNFLSIYQVGWKMVVVDYKKSVSSSISQTRPVSLEGPRDYSDWFHTTELVTSRDPTDLRV